MNKNIIAAALIVAGLAASTAFTAHLVTETIDMFEATTKANEEKHIISTVGAFDNTTIGANGEIYYHFKATDGSVWWCLLESQMGFVPKADAHYILRYDNKGTTKENKPCDCAPKYNCECEVYDDEFVSITELVDIAEKE